MPAIECPSCQTTGQVPDHFSGRTIRCSQCGARFQVGDLLSAVLSEVLLVNSAEDGESGLSTVDMLAIQTPIDDSADGEWPRPAAQSGVATAVAGTATAAAGVATAVASAPEDVEDSAAEDGLLRYKVLTQKDPKFTGKSGPAALEHAINAYARKGWRVKAVTPATFPGFVGGNREELIVVLER